MKEKTFITKSTVQNLEFHVDQVCKRAKNLVEFLNNKFYEVEVEGKFGTKKKTVNCFGHASLMTDNVELFLPVLLKSGVLSEEDFALLDFYNESDRVEEFIKDLYSRESMGKIYVSEDELMTVFLLTAFDESKYSKQLA